MPNDVLEQTDIELLTDVEEPEIKESETEEDEVTEVTEVEKDEDKEKSEEKLDEPFPYERPSIQEIKKEFPDFFKKFPIFRDVVFQETEYRKLFPTIEDAKEAIDDNLAFNGLRDSILAGKTDDLFDAVEQTDKAAAVKLATSFLPTLYKKNQELYTAAVTPLLETLVRKLGGASDENTRNAGLVVAHFLWDKDGFDIVAGKKTFARSTEESDDAKKIREERSKFESEKYSEFRGSVIADMQSGMERLITRGLDPDGTMSDYAKKTLINDIISQVDKSLSADNGHMNVMNSRWLRARKEGLNTASKEKIVSAYLSRAKQVIPSIRDKARNDFLGIRRKSSEAKSEEIDNKSSKIKEVVSGRSGGNSSDKIVLKPSRDLYRKMSDIDILNS